MICKKKLWLCICEINAIQIIFRCRLVIHTRENREAITMLSKGYFSTKSHNGNSLSTVYRNHEEILIPSKTQMREGRTENKIK